MNVQASEIYLLIALCVAFICFFVLLINPIYIKNKKKLEKKAEEENNKVQANVLEVFDYLGTKIVHENGTYTVNHKGRIAFFKTWNDLPQEYKKMVKELDSRSLNQKIGDDYFLESINGYHYLTLPGGKKKKYNTLNEIPAHIRKAIGK
jgi:lipopolysaccharide export LptBFGC system permease protein LptF